MPFAVAQEPVDRTVDNVMRQVPERCFTTPMISIGTNGQCGPQRDLMLTLVGLYVGVDISGPWGGCDVDSNPQIPASEPGDTREWVLDTWEWLTSLPGVDCSW